MRELAREHRHEVIARAALEVHHHGADRRAPESAIALMVRSIFAGCVEKPGTIGAISTPQSMPGVNQLAHRPQPLHRMRDAGLELLPRVFVHRRHADVHAARVRADRSCSTSVSRTIIGPLVTMPTGDRGVAQRFEHAARELVRALDRLIRIGGGAEADVSFVHDGLSSSRRSTSTKLVLTKITDAN